LLANVIIRRTLITRLGGFGLFQDRSRRQNAFRTLCRVLLIAIGFLALCGCSGPEITYRYRLKVEVNTPDGVISGSSIIETTLTNNQDIKWAPMEARTFTSRVCGEAAFVDLGRGRNLVAILAMGKSAKHDIDFREIVPIALGVKPYQPKDVFEALARASESPRPVTVPSTHLPTLVTFGNVDDPTSAKVLDPDNLSVVFGDGYLLRRVTIELIPMSWWRLPGCSHPEGPTIATHLPWLTNPLPWVKPLGRGTDTYIDTRPAARADYRISIEQFKRKM
jgi:hypothetical protein